MAFSLTGLMTPIGEIIKKIDIFNTLITSLETYKDDVYTDLSAQGYQDQYVPVPAQFASMKSAVSGWISTLIPDCTACILDRDLVLDELPIYSFDLTSVLSGIYDYMTDNSLTIETSVVTLGGSDVNKFSSTPVISGGTYQVAADGVTGDVPLGPVLFCSRTLDGVSSPGNGVVAHLRYDGLESQLARSSTITAELTSKATIGAERAQLFAVLPATGPYQPNPESPGVGPVLINPEASNLITSNAKFNTWVGNAPTGWTMSGTITTDYTDESGTGAGPLLVKTGGITALKQVTGLLNNKLYFLGASVENKGNSDADDNVVGIKMRTLADSDLCTQATISMDTDDDEIRGVVYTFFRLNSGVDLNDVYVELEYVTEGHASNNIAWHKVVVSPVTYYNGLAWVWWPPYHISSDTSYAPLNNQTSIVISNNNNGKFQTFFRRAYNIQLPTADSPTLADSLAGG